MRTMKLGVSLVIRLSCCALGSAALVACQSATGPDTAPTPTPSETAPLGRLVVGPERDLDAVIDRVAVAFHQDGSAFTAGHATHDVRVVDGVAEIVPIHHDLALARGEVRGRAIALETTNVWRGDMIVGGAQESVRIADDGSLEIGRGQVAERLQNRDDGVEQSWAFAAAPAGDGDLVVEVAVSGHRLVADNASGLHFRADDGLGFRYSHAVWLDAAGGEYEIPARFDGARITMTVPHDLLLESHFPAVLDPTITPEIDVDVPVNGTTGATNRNATIAFSGTQYLVVWQDDRDSKNSDIWAARITTAGAITDTGGIKINDAAGVQSNPTVAWNGSNFIVAWENFVTTTNADIVAASVAANGAVTQLGNVAATAVNETAPQVASRGGGNTLLAWRSDADIRAALSTGGAFGAAFVVANSAAIEKEPTVAANPAGDYLVAYSEGASAENLRGRLVTSAGAVNGAVFDISAAAGSQTGPTATFNGTNYAVVWMNNNAGLNLYGARVSPTGMVLDTRMEGMVTVGGVPISLAVNNQEIPSIACLSSGGCIVLWQDRRAVPTTGVDIFGQLVNADFTLNGAEFAVTTAIRSQFTPAVVASATDYFSTWDDLREGGPFQVTGSRISAAGAVLDANGLVLVRGNNRQSEPAMAMNGSVVSAIWTDSRNDTGDLFQVRFNVNGSKLDANGRVVQVAPFSQSAPAMAGSSTRFLAVWSDSRGADPDIFGARVNNDGSVADSPPIIIAQVTQQQLVPDVASDGTSWFVVWQDRRTTGNGFDIIGALIDANGAVTVNNVAVCATTGDQTRPAIAYDSTNNQYMVVWSDARAGSGGDIFAARVSAAGAVLDSCGVLVSGAANGQFQPDIAFSSGRYLAVWEDRRSDGNGDVFASRLTGGGAVTVLDVNGIAVSAATGVQTEVVVAPLDANNFFIAWTDGRTSGTTGLDIYGGAVAGSGVVSQPAFAISAVAGDESGPAVTNLVGQREARLAYSKPRPDLGTARVEVRRVSMSSTVGNPCSVASQCESGFCVDARCCDTACGGGILSDCQACSIARGAQVDGVCAPVPATYSCRNYANTFCDIREYCTGTSPDCPPDLGKNQTLVCNATTGARCPANDVSGAPHACP